MVRLPERFAIGAALAFVVLAAGCGGGARRSSIPVAPPPVVPEPRQETAEPERAAAPEVPERAAEKPSPLVSDDDLYFGFEGRAYANAAGRVLRYRLFRPPDYDPEKRYPLVIFLHGSSGAGSDNRRQLDGSRRAGVARWVSPESQAAHPAFVIAPQADPAHAPTWVRQWRRSPQPNPKRAEPLELVVELLDALADEFSIDRDRVYLTGFSMGGFGVWIGVSRHPKTFAAAVPVAGGGDPTHVGDTEAAIWAFHGTEDRVVPVRRSREMVEALEEAGKKARYTEYEGVGHAIWDRAFGEPGLGDWLFGQKRR